MKSYYQVWQTVHIKANRIYGTIRGESGTFVLELPKSSKILPCDRAGAKNVFFNALILSAFDLKKAEDRISKMFNIKCHFSKVDGPAI